MEKAVSWAAFMGYLKYVWKEKKILFLFGLLFIPAYIMANYLQVYLPKMIIMELEERRSIAYLGISILIFVLILMLSIILRETMSSKLEYGNRQIMQKAQNEYAEKLLYIDYGCLENKEFLTMKNMVKESLFGGSIGHAQERAKFTDFMQTLVMMAASAGNIFVYLFYLGKLSLWLVVILFSVCVFGLFFNKRFFEKNEIKYGQKAADSWQKLNYVTRKTEDFSMAKDIRLYRMDTWFNGLIDSFLKERLYYKKKEQTASGLSEGNYRICMGVFYAALLGMVLVRFWRGDIGISDVVFYANMGPAVYALIVNDLAGESIKLFRIVREFRRFQRFMDYGEDTGKVQATIQKEPPKITLEHVSFAYPKAEKEALKDISLQIQAGEKVAVVGVNGAGKTTLMKLICGLLHPTGGRILLNGVDMESMEAEERYAWFSCTFQDVQFLPVSIRENISQEINIPVDRPGDVKRCNLREYVEASVAMDEKIWSCLDRAGIRREIEELPDKLDTLLEKSINEDAVDFSGGQRQKLILARALYRGAGALILDEPTAALDALAENDIYEKYAEFAREKTSFFVSHRLSSTRFCDRILLLNGGVIAEEGTHEELLARGGLYAEMFKMQSKYYQGGVGE